MGGKLIALLALSNEVRAAFRDRYQGSTSLISRKNRVAQLALLTTTSALGRSSLYNRLKVDGTTYWTPIGATRGYGEFQFSNGLYGAIREFADTHCSPTERKAAWGSGFRNKREVVRKTLQFLGFGRQFLKHGVQREIFVAPLGADSLRFLRGEVSRPRFHDWPAQMLAEVALQRWMLPRSERDQRYRAFVSNEYRLWEERS